MRSRRFFSWLWRANAVLIFLAGLLTVGATGIVLYKFAADAMQPRHAEDVMTVAGRQIDSTKEHLTDFEQVRGGNFLRATLYVEQEYEISSGSKDSRSVQNELYFDLPTRKSHWLIPQYKGIIVSQHRLPDDNYGDDPQPLRANVYGLLDRDDNGDGQLTGRDLMEVAVAGPAGKPLHRTGLRVDSIDGTHLGEDGTEVLVFHTVGGKFRLLAVDLATGKLTANSELTID